MQELVRAFEVIFFALGLGALAVVAVLGLFIVTRVLEAARKEKAEKAEKELFEAEVLIILKQERQGWRVVHRAARKDMPKLHDFVLSQADRTTCAYVKVREDDLTYVERYSPVKPAAICKRYWVLRTYLPGVRSSAAEYSDMLYAGDGTGALQRFLQSHLFWDPALSQWTVVQTIEGARIPIASGAGPRLLRTNEGIFGAGTGTPLNNHQATA
ncbi:MAG: hypothetical protein G01um1014106_426 [Parcubacteria group bacterium Gr01-1014_106]|nr:MAG: hypothetical protein G01um1014106_426 [Parcubacteria group bacterium Gr01-1014_106]